MIKIFNELSSECEFRVYEFLKVASQTKADILRV